jgi:hypothetical protein
MKMKLTAAANPDEYVASLAGWQRAYVSALRELVRRTAPTLDERLKWGHLVYFAGGPVLLIRAEPHRVLFGFWRGKRLRHIEPRLAGSGKYELATLELRQGTTFDRDTAIGLVAEAMRLTRALGDATAAAGEHRRAGSARR